MQHAAALSGAPPKPSSGSIGYSQCWEDPATVREALRITPDDDVLAVTSGGCNVLALLLDRPHSITAVDINPAQNYDFAWPEGEAGR